MALEVLKKLSYKYKESNGSCTGSDNNYSKLVSARLNMLELWTAAFLFFCAIYDFHYEGKNHFFIYLFCQAAAFLLMGVGYCGTFVPS
jgi:hypothetical protein